MKTLIAVLVTVAVSSNLQAQTKADSVLLSLMPIQWDFEFQTFVHTSHGDYYPNAFWSGVIDAELSDSIHLTTLCSGPNGSIKTTQIDSIGIHLNSDTLSFTIVSQKNYPQWTLSIVFDTSSKTIIHLLFDETNGANVFAAATFDVKDLVCELSNSNEKNVAYVDQSYLTKWAGYVGNNMATYQHSMPNNGWLSIGKASSSERIENNFQKMRECSYYEDIQPSIHFELGANSKNIRIFNLLGRECDHVAIPVGAESVEYNTSRLAPGLYIATLGQRAVKFVVR